MRVDFPQTHSRAILQMLAFEAEPAHLPRSLITAIWESLDQANQWPVTPAHASVSLEECRPEIQNALQEEPGW